MPHLRTLKALYVCGAKAFEEADRQGQIDMTLEARYKGLDVLVDPNIPDDDLEFHKYFEDKKL